MVSLSLLGNERERTSGTSENALSRTCPASRPRMGSSPGRLATTDSRGRAPRRKRERRRARPGSRVDAASVGDAVRDIATPVRIRQTTPASVTERAPVVRWAPRSRWTTCEHVVRPGANDRKPRTKAGTTRRAGRTPPARPVQERAGVGSRRACSRMDAGVVWCPGCRPFMGPLIGRVLRDTRHWLRRETRPHAREVRARDSACATLSRRPSLLSRVRHADAVSRCVTRRSGGQVSRPGRVTA